MKTNNTIVQKMIRSTCTAQKSNMERMIREAIARDCDSRSYINTLQREASRRHSSAVSQVMDSIESALFGNHVNDSSAVY